MGWGCVGVVGVGWVGGVDVTTVPIYIRCTVLHYVLFGMK